MLQDIDPDRLILFFCFLTLRCAKTSREEFRITLPEDALARLEKALKNEDPDLAGVHILGSRYFDRRNTGTFSPWPRSPKGEKPINFVMLGLRFLIHFQAPLEASDLCLRKGQSWPIIFDEFKGSELHRVSMNMVGRFPSPWARLKKRNTAA